MLKVLLATTILSVLGRAHVHEAEHIDLSDHHDSVSRLQEALEDHGYTVNRHATRVGSSLSLERENKEAAKPARGPRMSSRRPQMRSGKPVLGSKQELIASVLEKLEMIDEVAADLEEEAVSLEKERRRGFWSYIKGKLFSSASEKKVEEEGIVGDIELSDEILGPDTEIDGASIPARRNAIVYTAEEGYDIASAIAIMEKADAWAAAEAAKKTNWKTRVAIKAGKAVACIGLFAVVTALGVGGWPIALVALGIGIAFAAAEAWQSRKEGSTAQGVGAFVFNVVKGTAMTALGVEVLSSAAGVIASIVDLACSTAIDVKEELAIPLTDEFNVGDGGALKAKLEALVTEGKLTAKEVTKAARAIKLKEYKDAVKAINDNDADLEADELALKSSAVETVKWLGCSAAATVVMAC